MKNENKVNELIEAHISRLEADIADRDQSTFSDGTRRNSLHAAFDEVDLKNIASLREGRVPLYNDHMDSITSGNEYTMMEFDDIVEAKRTAARQRCRIAELELGRDWRDQ